MAGDFVDGHRAESRDLNRQWLTSLSFSSEAPLTAAVFPQDKIYK